MGWTTPKTMNVGDPGVSADWNTYIRDNLTALQPQAAAVTTLETTASTSYTNLATTGPAVTLTTGTSCLVEVNAGFFNSTAGDGCYMGYAVSGASTIAANDAAAVGATSATINALGQAGFPFLQTGLTAGTNTFTAKYRAITGGTAAWANRSIIVTACF